MCCKLSENDCLEYYSFYMVLYAPVQFSTVQVIKFKTMMNMQIFEWWIGCTGILKKQNNNGKMVQFLRNVWNLQNTQHTIRQRHIASKNVSENMFSSQNTNNFQTLSARIYGVCVRVCVFMLLNEMKKTKLNREIKILSQ